MSDKPIQIDLGQVVASKLGTKARWVPGWLIRWLEGVIHKDELNELLRKHHPAEGAPFARGVLTDLEVETTVVNPEALPQDGRVIFACNHPLGGLDGMALIDLFTAKYGDKVKFVVNDLLMAVEPLRTCFLPINKHGRQERSSVSDIETAMDGDAPIVVFPAGLVSRLHGDGSISDLEWHKMFIIKAIKHHRDIVPVYFSGENTRKFYRTARWRKRLGIKFNVEMILLPSELFKARGKHFSVVIGERIPWQTLRGGLGAKEQANAIRKIVYHLKDKHHD